MRWWQRLARSGAAPAGRAGGGPPPTSSWHLWWEGLPAEPLVEVAVTLEVVREPRVSRLYFWALQASFVDAAGGAHGAGHVGPQWNPRHPDHRALNWGGYARPPAGAVLDGTPSPLPSTPDDPNTRDFPWRAGVAYRLAIRRGVGGWDGVIAEPGRDELVVRTLHAGGDRLVAPVVWSEVFCHCDDPAVEVRWSAPEARTASGRVVRPRALRVGFPVGGRDCPDTDVRLDADGAGVRQRTATPRTARSGQVLALR